MDVGTLRTLDLGEDPTKSREECGTKIAATFGLSVATLVSVALGSEIGRPIPEGPPSANKKS